MNDIVNFLENFHNLTLFQVFINLDMDQILH